MEKEFDYLIIGQGLAGSILAYTLLEKGKKVLVLDEPKLQNCSKIAAGICNPITGRNLVRTWKSRELFTFLNDFYPKLEKQFNSNFFFSVPIYRPFQTLEQQQDWSAQEEKATEEVIYPKNPLFEKNVNEPLGGLLIKNGGHLRTDIFLEAIKKYLIEHNAYQEKLFDFDDLMLNDKATKESYQKVVYQDIKANHIIFCRGVLDKTNPFFDKLPIAPAKGEILHIDFDKIEENKSHQNQEMIRKLNQFILNKGCWLVPFKDKIIENNLNNKVNGLDENVITTFRTGSTYNHDDLTLKPTEEARQEIETKLKGVLNLDYQVTKQEVGIRPSTRTRYPLMGTHKDYPQMSIFNGFGAKGVSMIPYFANEFVEHLFNGKELDKILRVNKWLLK
ncbi:FAD dependent oxidoreductase [Bernardetia litoralis DSM 6794]|uniref:FAD dependent oxidoreductase n=1 Tax=Bernardetia litoralis (strain ATCC 23117 / DSM 6794 / NBRC 15988 / NCIMB 1366 / Fx l1 / Sio-4) TaxID=880071 RepID=I4AHA0_BERLS|nr:FAD-dependent oxidoreductase [Bernardetia litoralis]AFM03335.1 FAD dependent oxidoreductase [Bernardetia litoralis DSM 6794]